MYIDLFEVPDRYTEGNVYSIYKSIEISSVAACTVMSSYYAFFSTYNRKIK